MTRGKHIAVSSCRSHRTYVDTEFRALSPPRRVSSSAPAGQLRLEALIAHRSLGAFSLSATGAVLSITLDTPVLPKPPSPAREACGTWLGL